MADTECPRFHDIDFVVFVSLRKQYEGCNLVLYLANSHGEVLVTINLANQYRATLAINT